MKKITIISNNNDIIHDIDARNDALLQKENTSTNVNFLRNVIISRSCSYSRSTTLLTHLPVVPHKFVSELGMC